MKIFDWVKRIQARIRNRRALEKKIKELKKRDPFVYPH